MTIIDNKVVDLSRIVVQGKPPRLSSDSVKDLSESISTDGLIHPPLVRKADMLLICGRDRYAAVKLMGQKRVEVRLVEATDAEVVQLRITENLNRRAFDVGERSAMRAEYAGQSSPCAIIEPPAQELHTATRKGRPASTKVAARKKVAAKLGVTEATLRRDEKKAAGVVTGEGSGPMPIPKFKMAWWDQKEFSEKLEDAHRELCTDLDDLSTVLTRAQSMVTMARAKHEGPHGRVDFGAWTQILKSLAGQVRSHRPSSACAYCRLVPKDMDRCPACHGCGYLTAGQMDAVPKELLR